MTKLPCCRICGQARRHLVPATLVRSSVAELIRADHDYQVNLKAELKIRQLRSKLDMLLTHQWQRLLEIQQIQT